MKKKQIKKKIKKKEIKKKIKIPKSIPIINKPEEISEAIKENTQMIILDEANNKEKIIEDLKEKKSIIEKMKGGLKNMARNLVRQKDNEKENREYKSEEKIEEKENQKIENQNPEVRIITFETLIANNIDALNAKIDAIHAMMMEGFKQVGVDFEKK